MAKLFHKKLRYEIITLLFSFLSLLNSQVESRTVPNTIDLPEFFIDAMSFYSGDSSSSRVDLYLTIPYDGLQFVKTDNGFVSKYEVTANFISDANISASEKVWSEEVIAKKFDETESKLAYSITQRSLLISPGAYTVRAQLRDNESKKVTTVMKKVTVGNYSLHEFGISDIMLVKKVTSDGDQKSIVPNVSGELARNDNSFYIFYEIYSPEKNDSIMLQYSITDKKGKEFVNRSQDYLTHANKSQIVVRFDSAQYSTGAYTISVEARSLKNGSNRNSVLKSKPFSVRWNNLPLSISDIDLAIRQLRYISKDNEYNIMADADSDEEKRRLFDEFWKKRDPNPDTKRNEFMEEYYSRVQYANEHFSHYIQGWRTDMGMVFILFGSPNNVERHPFDINAKPYEIWTYYDYNRNVTFIDETGFGDYRLTTPLYGDDYRYRN